jgi:hypothetical protein
VQLRLATRHAFTSISPPPSRRRRRVHRRRHAVAARRRHADLSYVYAAAREIARRSTASPSS